MDLGGVRWRTQSVNMMKFIVYMFEIYLIYMYIYFIYVYMFMCIY